METKRILVLGVGNILLQDEGVGVRVVESLEQQYVFSKNVETMDGGTLGLRLMEAIGACNYLIVVDAVLNGGPPGSLYRLTGDDLRKSLAFKNSLHQVDLVETLAYCGLVGNRPECVIVGVEPKEYTAYSDVLTPMIQEKMGHIIREVLKEVAAAGGTYSSRVPERPAAVQEK